MIRMMIARGLLLLCAATPATPAAATDVDLSAHPELAPDMLLPPIVAELKRTLKDPRSIRDFVLCPADKVKLKDGKPVRWSVQFSLAAKNSYGAYDGVKMYAAVFRDGRLSGGIVATQFASDEGFEGLINAMIARKMATCPTISDERIQQLVNPGASIFREP